MLEKERELFWLATVQPAIQLKDELIFKASQLRQRKVAAEGSDGNQVLQKVFVRDLIQTSKTVCSCNRQWAGSEM